MTRITTPFDSFMTDLAALWDQFWVVGLITLGAVVLVAIVAVLTRRRSRARFREPQYRRHTYWE